MKQIILASNSFRRKELLKKLVPNFLVEPADIDEKYDINLSHYDLIKKISYDKAKYVFDKHPNDIIIAGDTAVSFEGKIIGKPERELINKYGEEKYKILFDSDENIKNEVKKEAYKILKNFSGKTHIVLTGVCIMSKERIFNDVSEVKVTFSEISDSDIYEYINTGEPFGKAGAYGAQDNAGKFIKYIEGDFYSIVGFPLNMVFEELKKF